MSQPLTRRVSLQPHPSQPSTFTSKVTVESEADARLRDHHAGPHTMQKTAFGGKRGSAAVGRIGKREWTMIAGMVVVALYVRLYKLGRPSSVV